MAYLAEYSQVAGNWDPALSPSTIPMAPVVPLVQANLEGALSNAVALALEGLEGESRWAPFPPTPVASGLQLSGDALGPQDDRLEGSASPDLLQGLLGRDTLQGGPGDDLLEGGPGADELWGGSGNDTLRGGVGDDRLRGEGGDGDQVQLAGPLNEYRVTLDPARGVLTLADQVPLRDGTDQITGVELFRFQDRRLNAAELMAIGLKQQSAPGTPAPLDLDGNGAYDLIDNRLLLQAGLGTFPAGTFSPPLGVTSEERASKEASVRQRFQQGQTMVNTAQGLRAPLDLDGDGRVEIFRDGLMLLRHRNGLGLSAISADLLATDALRDADQILAHLISLTPL